MKHALEILKIIEGGIRLDVTKVKNYSKLLSEKLEEEGETGLSNKIQKLLNSNNSIITEKSNLIHARRLPIDQESRLSMAEVKQPMEFNEQVFLNRDTELDLERFLNYYQHSGDIIAKGLDIPTTMLLYGAPGTGKSLLARYVAYKLDLPIVIARLDSMISSFLGNTAKNIRIIFEYVNSNPCVLFLDEFDAIAKLRDDKNELGELKRVVNSLLQNIDMLDKNSVLIAATNHEQLLDPAVWRRFYFKLKLNSPDLSARIKMIKYFALPMNYLESEDLQLLGYLFEGLTGSAISIIMNQAKINSVLNDSELTLPFITNSFFDYINMEQHIDCSVREIKDKIAYIRSVNPKEFSYRNIGRLLGISKSLVQKHMTKGGDNDGRQQETTTD